jgi:adenylate cyclase
MRKQIKAIPLAAGLAVVFLLALVTASGFLDRPDRVFWDAFQKVASGARRPDPRLLLVAVDQQGMDYFTSQGVLWPWPRDLWARLITVAEEAGAEAVLFDVLFDDAGIDRLNSSGTYTDMALADKLSDPLPTVIAAQLLQHRARPDSLPPGLERAGPPFKPYSVGSSGFRLPYWRFRKAGMGLANIEPDADGVIRWQPLLYSTGDHSYPTLASRTAQLIEGAALRTPRLDRSGRMWLRYYGAGGPDASFPYVSAADVIMGSHPPDSLRGRILVVGGLAAGLLDYKPTPVAVAGEPYPGFEIQATALSNLLQGDELTLPHPVVSAVFPLVMGVLGVAAVGLLGSVWLQIALLICLTAAIPLIGLGAFYAGWLLPVTSPLLACFGGVGARLYASWQLEGRQKRKLRHLFSRYLDDSVIEELIDRPEELQMQGRQLTATVLFADVVGFSTVSEKLSPVETVAILNDYYTVFVDVMLKQRGLLDKYIGDAVMVIFGAPVADARTPVLASRAVLEALAAIDGLSRSRAEKNLPVLSMCIGAHTDSVVVGNIGHPNRMDYTAIGSGVNIASRLEGANRMLGTRNLVSERFCDGVPETTKRREIGRVMLKGLTHPITVYELISDDDAGLWLDEWAKAWKLWREGDRSGALAIWGKIIGQRSADRALEVLVNRLTPHLGKEGVDDELLVFTSK